VRVRALRHAADGISTILQMHWAALDFETATSSRASACALGLVIVEDGEERSRQHWLIRPPHNEYAAGNIAIHGIHPEDTEDAPEFDRVWAEAMTMIEDRPIVAHNAGFDVGVIRGGCQAFRIAPPSSVYHCTVQLSRKTWPELVNHKLPMVAGHVGATLDHHEALSDAAACSQIVRACIDVAGVDSLASLSEHHRLREKRVDVR
jgi:DNA polymerase-3 subunit epsilon